MFDTHAYHDLPSLPADAVTDCRRWRRPRRRSWLSAGWRMAVPCGAPSVWSSPRLTLTSPPAPPTWTSLTWSSPISARTPAWRHWRAGASPRSASMSTSLPQLVSLTPLCGTAASTHLPRHTRLHQYTSSSYAYKAFYFFWIWWVFLCHFNVPIPNNWCTYLSLWNIIPINDWVI